MIGARIVVDAGMLDLANQAFASPSPIARWATCGSALEVDPRLISHHGFVFQKLWDNL